VNDVTPTSAERGPALLATSNLTVRFGGVSAVDDLTIDICQGALTGIIGPNGAGKSTLIDAVSGLVGSTGAIRFDGIAIEGWPPHKRARAGIGRTFQGLELFDEMSVTDNLLVSAEGTLGPTMLRDLLRPAAKRAASEDVERVLALVGLHGRGQALPTELSLGERRLVSIAGALAGGAQLVLLDEPAAGLNSTETLQLGDTLRRLIDQGLTVALVDHDMGLVLGISDAIHVLDFGKLIASGTPAEVRTNELVLEAYLGRGDAGTAAEAGVA
jgi:branched-chain amino acid transport system ATP-binding protein